ncbi:hypothetical protein MKW92_037112 [Papaver armeniacum]|nr:hypothetical protein MKW92_037112 [Papaver armeniacum]
MTISCDPILHMKSENVMANISSLPRASASCVFKFSPKQVKGFFYIERWLRCCLCFHKDAVCLEDFHADFCGVWKLTRSKSTNVD